MDPVLVTREAFIRHTRETLDDLQTLLETESGKAVPRNMLLSFADGELINGEPALHRLVDEAYSTHNFIFQKVELLVTGIKEDTVTVEVTVKGEGSCEFGWNWSGRRGPYVFAVTHSVDCQMRGQELSDGIPPDARQYYHFPRGDERNAMAREAFEDYTRLYLSNFLKQAISKFGLESSSQINLRFPKGEIITGQPGVKRLIDEVYLAPDKINPCVELFIESISVNLIILMVVPSRFPPMAFGQNWTGSMGPFYFVSINEVQPLLEPGPPTVEPLPPPTAKQEIGPGRS